MEEKTMELGKKIASLRKVKNITQAQLAEYLSVNPQTVSRWEAEGGTPDVMLLPKIASFFGVSLDELFGVTDMEQINNLVYKYSVLRDEKSFEEVMRSIEFALNSLYEECVTAKGDKKEEIQQNIQQIKAWKMHIYIQKSRGALEQAEKELDELRKEIATDNPLYVPLKLQKQQFRIQMGDAVSVLKQSGKEWKENSCKETLYSYMAALLDAQRSAEILQLWETSEVKSLAEELDTESKPLWQMMFECAVVEQDFGFFEEYYARYKMFATEEELFKVNYLYAELYSLKGMKQEKEKLKEELLIALDNLKLNAYIKEFYQTKIKLL